MHTYKSHYLRDTFPKALAALDDDSPDASGQSPLQTLWKGFAALDTVGDSRDSREGVRVSTRAGAGRKPMPAIPDDFEGFKTVPEDGTGGVAEIARRAQLAVEPKGGIGLLHLPTKP